MRKLLLIVFFPLTVCSQNSHKNISHKFFTVSSKHFILTYKDDIFESLTTSNHDTVIKKEDYFLDPTFVDFNKDGYKDILIEYLSNTPDDCSIYLFDKKHETFRLLKGRYPSPKFIKNNYFYSYYKNGCADLNWVSDLFKIKNFKAIKVASIIGNGCQDEFDGIFIYKFKEDNKNLKEKLPIGRIQKYKNYKWGFIKQYWTKNYLKFK